MRYKDELSLKKVVIIRNAYDWQYGGAEQFTYNLAHSMQSRGIEPLVVTRVPELLRHCRQDKIPTFKNIWLKNETHRRWMPIYYLLSPLLVGQYMWLLLRTDADLLLVSSRDDQIFGTVAARILGKPVIWFDHSDMKYTVARPFRFLSGSYYRSLAIASRVIAGSQAELEKILTGLPRSKAKHFVMINNGAMKGSGEPLAKPVGIFIVAYAGRLDRDKGIFDLLEAAKDIVSAHPNVQFWIAGKGPDEDAFRAGISESALDSNFNLIGHMENVWQLLLAADLFVYPTHHDASPLAPVEALLAGLPVVASRIGGIPEALPVTAGVLVPAHEPKELAKAIIELVSMPEKLAALKAGTKFAAKAMDFDAVMDTKYLPLFQEVIEEHNENRR